MLRKMALALALGVALLSGGAAVAQEQFQFQQNISDQSFYETARPIDDPTTGPRPVYGGLYTPTEIDLYTFTAGADAKIPVEALVPTRYSNKDFRPTVAVMGRGIEGSANEIIPFTLHSDLLARIIPPPPPGPRERVVEPLSAEAFYRGKSESVQFRKGEVYYVAVYNLEYRTGDYVLAFGSQDSFSKTSSDNYIAQGLALKFGLAPGKEVPKADLFGLFLVLAGLVLGLGSVAVIDVLGVLSLRKPKYFDLTVTLSRITKWITWAGVLFIIAGSSLLYHESGSTGVATFQNLFLLLIIINALVMTFKLSPDLYKLQAARKTGAIPRNIKVRTAIHFTVSFISWWGFTFLLAWYLIVSR